MKKISRAYNAQNYPKNWFFEVKSCTNNFLMEKMKKMSETVDMQNKGSEGYINMAPNYNGIAFTASCDLVFKGRYQPNGYTEKILHQKRLEFKSKLNN